MKWLNHKFYVTFFVCSLPIITVAQNHNLPLNQTYNYEFEKESVRSEKIIYTSFQPILERQTKSLSLNDSLVIPTLFSPKLFEKSFVARKLFFEHFVTLDTGKIHLTIDPLINFEIGKEITAGISKKEFSLYKNTRGFNVKLDLGNHFSFESSFRENQAVLPSYLKDRAEKTGTIYGQGRWKRFGDDGYDFAMASAYISFSPSDWLNVQAGHGKHFVGNGLRSFLLSDLSFNYPYLKLQTNWFDDKVQYTNLFSLYQDLNRLESSSAAEGLFERKQAASHYLEFSPNNHFYFGIFESVIFPSLDSSGNIPIGANYWLPIVGINTIINGTESPGNTLWGTNVKINIGKKVQMYHQLSIKDEDFNNVGFQLGTKLFLANTLLFQLEANSTSSNNQDDLFFHYNESLTEPLPEDATELIATLQWQKNRWISRLSSNNIKNIEYDIQFFDFRQSFVVNPSFNFSLNFGIQYRKESYEPENIAFVTTNSAVGAKNLPSESESLFLYFGLSTNLQNLYFNY